MSQGQFVSGTTTVVFDQVSIFETPALVNNMRTQHCPGTSGAIPLFLDLMATGFQMEVLCTPQTTAPWTQASTNRASEYLQTVSGATGTLTIHGKATDDVRLDAVTLSTQRRTGTTGVAHQFLNLSFTRLT